AAWSPEAPGAFDGAGPPSRALGPRRAHARSGGGGDRRVRPPDPGHRRRRDHPLDRAQSAARPRPLPAHHGDGCRTHHRGRYADRDRPKPRRAARLPRPMTLILDAVQCVYEGAPAVRGVSLTLANGEVLCLLGRNGAGKTTTLKAITGLLKPASGSI